jgi:hypothetical protein
MKTEMFFLLALAALTMLGSTVNAATVYDNGLSLSNVSVSPNSVVAGSNATIRFQLYNIVGIWVYDTTLQASGSYPLLNVSPLNSKLIGTVNSGYNPQYYNYTVAIPNTTPSGVYTLTFTATYLVYAATGTVIATSSMPISFFIQNKPEIKVVASNPQPSTLYTGRNQTLDLVIENDGYGTARNVSVAVSGGSGLNILSSVDTFFVSNLTRGSTATEPLLVSARNISHTYLLENITYYSSTLNRRFSTTQRINLSVAPSAQFAISSSGPGPAIGAADVPVNFRITNTGTSPTSELQLNLQTSYPLTPVASTAYVGSLQPGASTNVTFLIDVDTQAVPGDYPVTIYEQWKQPNGAVDQQFFGSDNYYVAVGGAASGLVGSTLEDAIAAIVVIVAVMLIYRRMRARNEKKKK